MFWTASFAHPDAQMQPPLSLCLEYLKGEGAQGSKKWLQEQNFFEWNSVFAHIFTKQETFDALVYNYTEFFRLIGTYKIQIPNIKLLIMQFCQTYELMQANKLLIKESYVDQIQIFMEGVFQSVDYTS